MIDRLGEYLPIYSSIVLGEEKWGKESRRQTVYSSRTGLATGLV